MVRAKTSTSRDIVVLCGVRLSTLLNIVRRLVRGGNDPARQEMGYRTHGIPPRRVTDAASRHPDLRDHPDSLQRTNRARSLALSGDAGNSPVFPPPLLPILNVLTEVLPRYPLEGISNLFSHRGVLDLQGGDQGFDRQGVVQSTQG